MLRTAQADPLGAVAPGKSGLFRLVGIRPHLEPPFGVGPFEDAPETGLVLEADFDGGDLPEEHFAGRPIEADPVALGEAPAVRLRRSGAVVDEEFVHAGNARLADLAGDDGRVRGGSAARGEHALGRGHAVEVVRRGLDAHQDHRLALRGALGGPVGLEHGHPDSRTRRGVEAVGDPDGRCPCRGVELVSQQLVDLGRLDPLDGLGPGDDPLLDHVRGDLHGRRGGPLRAPGLEHVQPATLDRELEVLHVPVVALQPLRDPLELAVDLGHHVAQLADLARRSNARHDVLALGVGQELAVQLLLAGVRVAGECNARARVVAHVPVDHGHDADGGAEIVGDLVEGPVIAGAAPEPRREHRLDREVQLLVRVRRELPPGFAADDLAVLRCEVAKGCCIEVRIELGALRLLRRVERGIELLSLHAHHDAPEHLDEAPVGVPAEAFVAGQSDETLERLLVQAQVENRVHHAGHGELGARPDGDEERVGRAAELLAGFALDRLDRLQHVVPGAVREALAAGEIVVAGFRGDREAGRDRQACIRHLGEAGALAAEQVAHRGVALSVAAAEGVDVASAGAVGTIGRSSCGHGWQAPSSSGRGGGPRGRPVRSVS